MPLLLSFASSSGTTKRAEIYGGNESWYDLSLVECRNGTRKIPDPILHCQRADIYIYTEEEGQINTSHGRRNTDEGRIDPMNGCNC